MLILKLVPLAAQEVQHGRGFLSVAVLLAVVAAVLSVCHLTFRSLLC